MKTKLPVNPLAINLLDNEISDRLAALWGTIKELPTRTFQNTSGSLIAIEEVGREANHILKLREALGILKSPRILTDKQTPNQEKRKNENTRERETEQQS